MEQLSSIADSSLEKILGRSELIKKVIEDIQKVSQTSLSILIEGETGTGKTFIAELIHDLSNRKDGPFIKVDIGSLMESIIESELFGHEKGAFTGADSMKCGFFERTHGGTILLDDIDNMSLHVQGKVLTAVEDKKIYPLGSSSDREVDVRILTATNKEIIRKMEKGLFREDLYYRLGEFVINVPPLRERKEDIIFFAERLLREICNEFRKENLTFGMEAVYMLKEYSWPGNIRELRNVLKRAVLYCDGDVIKPEHIMISCNGTLQTDHSPRQTLKETLKKKELEIITDTLSVTAGDKSSAASMLGMSYRNLLLKIKEYGL